VKRILPVVLLLTAATACGGGSDAPDASDAGVAESSSAPAATGAPGGTAAQTFLLMGNDNDEFVPKTVNAKVGTLTLTLKNGNVPHNVVFRDDAFEGIPTISGDETASTTLTFPKAGTYDFTCTIHPGMDGKIVVS
jgi:plastocyanin